MLRVASLGNSSIEGSGHRQIAEIQRARILSAMLDSAGELGVRNVSISDVVQRSGVSRRTFYELFADREDCFSAAFEQALADARERVVPAYMAEDRWRERVRAGLFELLCLFDERPQAGRVLVTESLAGGQRTFARREELVAKLTSIVEAGASAGKTPTSPPPLTGEGVVGGVLTVVQRRLAGKPDGSLAQLTNPLMSMIVMPYLGGAAARGELRRALPAVSARPGRDSAGDPFKGAGMRLTYRTVRVLMALAERPGASNRLIGQVAEVKDQGQISKLLARLRRAGLVSNDVQGGPGMGAPNVWTLTPSGRDVTDRIRAHSEGLE